MIARYSLSFVSQSLKLEAYRNCGMLWQESAFDNDKDEVHNMKRWKT